MIAYYEKRGVDFYFRDNRDGVKSKLRCSPHIHPHIEFVYMIEGHTDAYADSFSGSIGPGDFYIAFPNQIHRFVSHGDEKYFLSIVDPELIPEFKDQLLNTLPQSNIIPAQSDAARQIGLVMQALTESAKSENKYRQTVLRGHLVALFGIILNSLPTSAYSGDDTRILRTILDFCTKNYTHQLSLSTLADELHLSKYYISHLFSNKLQISFNDYINSLRVSAACRLLSRTDKNVTDICAEVGFSTLRTFNRAFLRHMETSPSAYRKNHSTQPAASASMPTA